MSAHDKAQSEASKFRVEHPEFSRPSPDRRERISGKAVFPRGEFDIQAPPLHKPRNHAEHKLMVRVEKILSYMRPEHADLLRRYYWEQERQENIAKDLRISQQAVSKQLQVALGQFKVTWAKHIAEVEDANGGDKYVA